MNDRSVVISNIKVIGWVSIIVFGLLGLYLANLFIIAQLMEWMNPMKGMLSGTDPNIQKIHSFKDLIDVILAVSVLFCASMVVFGRWLVQLKQWGAIGFQAGAIILVIATLFTIAYVIATTNYSLNTNPVKLPGDESNDPVDFYSFIIKYQVISYSLIGLIVVWILTKSSLLFYKKTYRNELK